MLEQLDQQWARRIFPDVNPHVWADPDTLYEVLLNALENDGTLVFGVEWDSGGPGAGAGAEWIYSTRDVFLAASADFGVMGPFVSLDVALAHTVPSASAGKLLITASAIAIHWPHYRLTELITRLEFEDLGPDARLKINGEDWSVAALTSVQAALARLQATSLRHTDATRADANAHPVDPTGVALWDLASPDPTTRHAATAKLHQHTREHRRENDYYDAMRPVLINEWNGLGPLRRFCSDGLIQAFRTEEDLITMEAIAMALALEGEDGLTELVSLAASDDFVLRHKAAVGIGVLHRSARWAVPSLIKALREEEQPLVVYNLLNAIGRIGGAEAVEFLESMYGFHREAAVQDGDLLEQLEQALSHARLT